MDGIITKHLRNYLQPFEDPLHLYRHWWNPLTEEKELLQQCRIRSNVLVVRRKDFSFHATKDTLKHGKEKRCNKDTICMNDKDTHISWMFILKKRLAEAYTYSRMDRKQEKQSTAAILPLELFYQLYNSDSSFRFWTVRPKFTLKMKSKAEADENKQFGLEG